MTPLGDHTFWGQDREIAARALVKASLHHATCETEEIDQDGRKWGSNLCDFPLKIRRLGRSQQDH